VIETPLNAPQPAIAATIPDPRAIAVRRFIDLHMMATSLVMDELRFGSSIDVTLRPSRGMVNVECESRHARSTRGHSWAGRRAPISEGALLERWQAQF
jgi:hypothetical protein